MTTNELITALRDLADECEDRKLIDLFDEAADCLKELDERISIMMGGVKDGENNAE